MIFDRFRNSESTESNFHHIGCLAHFLNLVVNKTTKFNMTSEENKINNTEVDEENDNECILY